MELEHWFVHYEDENKTQVIDIPYQDGLKMTVIMPEENLYEFESGLSTEKSNHYFRKCEYFREIILKMPKFKFGVTYDLKKEWLKLKPFSGGTLLKIVYYFFRFDLNIYDSHNSKWQITQTKFKKRDITQRVSRKQNQLENFVLILSSEITLVDSPRNWESQVALAFVYVKNARWRSNTLVFVQLWASN